MAISILKFFTQSKEKSKDFQKIIFLGLYRPLRTRLKFSFFGMYHHSFYPENIFKKFKAIRSIKKISPQTWSFFNIKVNQDNQIDFKFNCAGETINIKELSVLWGLKNNNLDQEIINSSHRFHWLLEKLEKGVSDKEIYMMLDVIDSWSEQFSGNYSGEAWHPYNVSERIINLIVFWQASSPLKSKLYKKNFLQFIQSQAIFLAGQLEYPASGIINNHILNNARALYISGQFLQNQSFTNLGCELFKTHLPLMVGSGGYLLEASSHYHMLLTKNILEVKKIAKETNDDEFLLFLNPILKKMLASAQNLIPLDLCNLQDMPRIGDISPDIPFDWFSPYKKFKASWNNLWDESIELIGSKDAPNDGWLKINHSPWFSVAYSHPESSMYPIGHGHDDFGSFCLYLSGSPIIVDIGQLNYQYKSTNKLNDSSAEMHNSVIIDGKSLLPSGNGLMSIFSGDAIKKSECRDSIDGKSLYWFTNTQSGSLWRRQLTIISNQELRLQDYFDKAMLIQGFLNFAPNSEIIMQSEKKLLVKINDISLTILISGVDKVWLEESTFNISYGRQLKSNRLHWKIKNKVSSGNSSISFIKND